MQLLSEYHSIYALHNYNSVVQYAQRKEEFRMA